MTKIDVIKLELHFWREQFRWGWIGTLVFLILFFYGAPRVQTAWNMGGLGFAGLMAAGFGTMAYRAHHHIRELLEQLGKE